MSQELFYTSAPRGLKPGSTGFCTVAQTRGLPAALADRLEWLSGYRPLFPAGDPRADLNPVSFAHWRVTIGPQTVSVLSRVGFAGLDHTRRSNKFAHHLILGPDERPSAGPAWLLRQPDVMETTWPGGEPVELDAGRPIPMGDFPAAPCRAWAAATGDAGWAGVLAEAYLAEPARPAYLVYPPGVNALELLAEAIALLPESRRWQVTFNTYFTDLPAGLSCSWRCCVAGTPAANEAARSAAATGNLLIDLTAPSGVAPDSPYVRFAQSGFLDESAAVPAISHAFPADDETPPAYATALQPSTGTATATSPPVVPPTATEVDWPLPSFRRAPVRTGARPFARGRWPFWVVTLLWPLLVATLAWNHLRSRHAAIPAPPTTAATQEGAMLAEQNAALRAQLTKLWNRLEAEKKSEFEKGKASAANAPPDPRIWVRRSEFSTTVPTPQHTDAEYARLSAELVQVRNELAKASTPSAPAPTTPGHAVRDEAGRIISQWVALADAPRGGGADADVTLAAWPNSKPAKLTLSIPNGSTSVYKQKPAPDGVVIYRSSADGLSGDLDRARLFLADGKLMLKWLTNESDDKDQKAIASILLVATVRVTDELGNEVGTIQFAEPERCDLVLHDRRVTFKKLLPPPQAGALRLIVLAGSATYTAADGGGTGASLTFRGRSGGSFTIDADARGVTTNWPEMNADAVAQKGLMDAEVDHTRQFLPKLKKNEIDNAKRKDDAYKAAFAAYDQAVDKDRSQAAVCDDLSRPFRATLALCLSNGAVLATIEVSKSPLKPE